MRLYAGSVKWLLESEGDIKPMKEENYAVDYIIKIDAHIILSVESRYNREWQFGGCKAKLTLREAEFES